MKELTHDQIETLERIFMPTAWKRIDKMLGENGGEPGRLAHYTTAENALKIIKTKSLWLRSPRVMQDYSEMEIGIQNVNTFFEVPENHSKSAQAFDGIADNVVQDSKIIFKQLENHIRYGTYLSCFSDHHSDETPDGRLSMWRAFGRNVPSVAIILRPPTKYSALPLRLFLRPVEYERTVQDEFDEVIDNVRAERTFLLGIREWVPFYFNIMLQMTAVTQKHRGFKEEQEWRLCHFPVQWPSAFVPSITEVIGGVSQIVHKVEFRNKPSQGVDHIELRELIDRVIVGPSQYQIPIWQSLVQELGDAGVDNPNDKVVCSSIPIRT